MRIVINRFEELEDFLREWTSFVYRDTYDLNVLIMLFRACSQNMQQNMSDVDFEDIAEAFTKDEITFLNKLVNHINMTA